MPALNGCVVAHVGMPSSLTLQRKSNLSWSDPLITLCIFAFMYMYRRGLKCKVVLQR